MPSYSGKEPQQAYNSPDKDRFNGDGSTTAFTLSRTVFSCLSIHSIALKSGPDKISSPYWASLFLKPLEPVRLEVPNLFNSFVILVVTVLSHLLLFAFITFYQNSLKSSS